MKSLKDFGVGKARMESIISEELVQFTGFLHSFLGKPVDIRSMFNAPLVNVLWRVVSSEQFDYNDPKLIDLLEKVSIVIQKLTSPQEQILLAYPWMGEIGPLRNMLGKDKNLLANKALLDTMKKSVEEHKSSIDFGAPRDLIDMVGGKVK